MPLGMTFAEEAEDDGDCEDTCRNCGEPGPLCECCPDCDGQGNNDPAGSCGGGCDFCPPSRRCGRCNGTGKVPQ
jgi:hypothetical protein